MRYSGVMRGGILAAVAAALHGAAAVGLGSTVIVPIDPLQSSITVRVCRGSWTCDLPSAGISGVIRVNPDSVTAPTQVSLQGFTINVTGSVVGNVSTVVAPVGTFMLTGTGLSLTYASPGTSFGPASVTAGQYRLVNVPTVLHGTLGYSATGSGCVTPVGGGAPTCTGAWDLATQGAIAGGVPNWFGPISGTGHLLTLGVNASVTIPFDPANPSVGTITFIVSAHGVGSACRGDYDVSGANTTTDIFAFLGGWFGHNPRADFDGDGVFTVNDIFLFIAAWFAAC
jgi:hypothetical protein